jgi:hypothetical protein
MIYKRPSERAGKMVLRFEIPGSMWVERVNLVGDFNDWNRESLPFVRDGGDNWAAEVELDAGEEYRFRYLVDGAYWRDDRHADKFVANARGGYDSVVVAELGGTPAPEMGRVEGGRAPVRAYYPIILGRAPVGPN